MRLYRFQKIHQTITIPDLVNFFQERIFYNLKNVLICLSGHAYFLVAKCHVINTITIFSMFKLINSLSIN